MTAWARTLTALSLLAIDPAGLRGALVRARPSPARDRFLDHSKSLFDEHTRLHPGLNFDDLTGGIDLAASLGAGEIVQRQGLLNGAARLFLLPMAERAEPVLISTLTEAIDANPEHAVIALDESGDDGGAVHGALADRLAFE
ncbi:MAG: magnesium chelatase ATPase subunit D, partial [Pseudomonadota bacterium]